MVVVTRTTQIVNGGTLNFLALYISSILGSLTLFGARLLKKRDKVGTPVRLHGSDYRRIPKHVNLKP